MQNLKIDKSQVRFHKHALVVACGLVLAQTAIVTWAVDDKYLLEEVLVTASKRGASSIQDVSYNISAVGGEFLEKTGVDDFSDVARAVPGLEIQDNGPNNKKFVIRGLASSQGASQTGVYLDEVPFSFQGTNVQQTELVSYDLERIEVLRGPQGTLYGDGSQGGTVRYITKKPSLDSIEASINLTLADMARGGGTQMSTNGMINIPVVEGIFGLRAVVTGRDNEGVVDRPDLNIDRSDESKTRGARIHGFWKITENTSALLSYHQQAVDLDDLTAVTKDADAVLGFVRSPFEDDTKVINLTIEHEFSVGAVTFSASDVSRDTLYNFDVSQFTPFPSSVTQPDDIDITSQELRFSSTLDGPLQFVVGGYHQKFKNNRLSFGSFVDPATGLVSPMTDPETYFFALRTLDSVETEALFGEITYDVTDRFSLLFGVRDFEVTTDQRQFVEVDVDLFGRTRGFLNANNAKNGDQVYKLQASFDINEDALIYLTWSEGFRQGGGNTPFANDPTLPLSYEPDYVTNYEFGWKTSWLENQWVLNGALYYMEWSDIQVSQNDATGATFFINNFGEADLYGFELEGVYHPSAVPGFSMNFGFNISNQELTEDSPATTTGLKGDPIPDTIEKSASVGLEQRFDIMGMDSFVRLDVAYTGKAQTTFSSTDPFYREWGDFIISNIRIGIEEGQWSASVFAKNLTNEREPMSWNVQAVPGIDDQIQMTRPRTVGVNVKWEF